MKVELFDILKCISEIKSDFKKMDGFNSSEAALSLVQEVLVNKYTKVECATCSGTGIIEDYCWKCNKDGSRKGTNVDCDRCNNTGYIDYICDDCNGEGVL